MDNQQLTRPAVAAPGLAPLWVACAGLLSLVVTMGIGRFAYTAMLPQMYEEGLLGVESGGVVAASNYLGYLVGALWTALSRRTRPFRRVVWGLAASIVTTLAMSFDWGVAGWLVVRFVAGVASAVGLVYTTGIIMRYLALRQAVHLSSVQFFGTGVGICVAAWLAQAMLDGWGTAQVGWAWIGVSACVCGGLALWGLWRAECLIRTMHPAAQPHAQTTHDIPNSGPLRWLALAYGLAGLGYIVNATFLPLMLRNQAGLTDSALTGWLWVGLAAIPLTWLWFRLATAVGGYAALMLATGLQALGVALPVLSSGYAVVMAGAVLLGGTFMGIAGLSQWIVRTPDVQLTVQRVGLITACYGVGQIIGPLLAAGLVRGDDFTVPVLIAAGALLLSLVCLVVSQRVERLSPVAGS